MTTAAFCAACHHLVIRFGLTGATCKHAAGEVGGHEQATSCSEKRSGQTVFVISVDGRHRAFPDGGPCLVAAA